VFGVRYNPNTEQIEWLSATVLIGAGQYVAGVTEREDGTGGG
jgi:hypothetical protein